MTVAVTEGPRRDVEAEIGLAAMRLSDSPVVYEALCHGEPVLRSALNQTVLAEISEPANGPPLVLDHDLAIRVNANRAQLAPVPDPDFLPDPDSGETVDRLRFKTGRDFRTQPLGATEPLLGEGGDAIIMPHSLTLLAGIGGTGKTTLALHAAVHFCAGLPWFGIQLARPLRIVLIENEGPHDPFAEKLNQICERFKNCPCGGEPHGDLGEGFDANATVLDAPWGKFSFKHAEYAGELNAHVKDFGADLVMANPLGRLGIRGAGTPEETREFLALMVDAGLGNDFGAFLVHHMAKGKQMSLSQQISGDWVGHPDTILILEQAGQRRSKLTFDKIRWGDQGKRDPLILNWLTDENGPVGYRTADTPQGVLDDTITERIDLFLKQQPNPSGISAIRRGVPGQARRIKELVERGITSGRYGSTGGARPRYWLLDAPSGKQETMTL